MTPEEHLIQHIHDFIRADNQEKTPYAEELAEQYLALYAQINERLRRCRDLLNKGMRSEAVHEARTAPALMQLADCVDFPERARWQNFCNDFGLPYPPPLELDILNSVKQAIKEEVELTPLLKQYRRAMYQGDHSEAVRLLREIRQRDPQNQVWQDNLRPLEEEQLALLSAEAERAIKRGDIKQLLELKNELENPQRLTTPPQQLLAAVDRTLEKHRQQVLKDEAERLLDKLGKAHQNGDFHSVARLLQRWQELEDDTLFDNSPWHASLTPIRNWYATEKEQRETETAFREAVISFSQTASQENVTEDELEQKWRELLSFGQVIPERLQQEYEQACSQVQARTRRRRRIHTLSAMVLILLAAVLGVFILHRVHRQQQRRTRLQQLQYFVDQNEFTEAQKLLDRIRQTDAGFFTSTALERIRDTFQTELDAEQHRQARLQAAMQQLDRIRKAGFDAPDAEVQRTLEQAQGWVRNPAEQNAVDQWRLDWSLQSSRQNERADRRLQQLNRKMERELEQKENAALDLQQQILAQMEEEIKIAEPYLPDASDNAAAAFAAVTDKIDSWRQQLNTHLSEHRQSLHEQQELLSRLNAGINDLSSYRDILDIYLLKFPDSAVAASLRKARSQWAHYEAAAALKTFDLSALPPAFEKHDLIRNWLTADGLLSGSVWHEDLQHVLNYADAVTVLQQKLQEFAAEAKDMLTLRVLYYRQRDSNRDWQALYYRQPLRNRTETDAEGGAYTVYWGDVYTYSADDLKPWVTHTSRLFPNRLTTQNYEIRLHRKEQDNVVPQGKFLLRFFGEAREAEQLDIYLLEAIDTLRQSDDIPAIPRAWLIKRLLHMLADTLPLKDTQEIRRWAEMAAKMPTDLPWMNQLHAAVIEARHTITTILAQLPATAELVQKLQLNRSLLRLTLDRKVDIAGAVTMNNGILTPKIATASDTEIWVLTFPAPGGPPRFSIIMEGRNRALPLAGNDLFMGQVLFAPRDRRNTATILQNIYPADAGKLEWPTSWPMNRRR